MKSSWMKVDRLGPVYEKKFLNYLNMRTKSS